jgi:hypothetical protein
MKKLALSVVLLVLSVAGLRAASDELWITFPRYLFGGMSGHGNVLVVVHYCENEKNLELELVWGSPDGEEGRSVTDITSENNGVPVAKDLFLSAGKYIFTATLHRSDGSKVVVSQTRFVTR